MNAVLDGAGGVLVVLGALAVLSGGVGLLRLPDFYTRVHAAGLTDTAGASLILIGLLLVVPDWGVAVRLVLILLFLLLTSPAAAHTLAQAARRDGIRAWLPPGPS